MNELDRRQFPQTRDESDRRAGGLACLLLLDLDALDVGAIQHSDSVSVALVDSCRLTQ